MECKFFCKNESAGGILQKDQVADIYNEFCITLYTITWMQSFNILDKNPTKNIVLLKNYLENETTML